MSRSHPARMRINPLAQLRLLLPAIIPSWRFFDAVTASPRLDFALLATEEEEAGRWEVFRPRPAVVTPGAMLRRLLWNAESNENLFLVSLAERLVKGESEATMIHSQRELLLRVARHLDRHGLCGDRGWLQIRLRFVHRIGATEDIDSEVAYISGTFSIAALLTP